MKNRYVGLIIIGISILMSIMVLIFNFALRNIVGQTCSHGSSCTMYDTISVQTWISFSIIAILAVIGIAIMFIKPKEKIIIKTVRQKKKKLDLSGLDKKEKEAISILQKENGEIFQRTLMEKMEIGKVGITRLLDKLEAKQLIERKRRGMNNIVVLKD